MAKVIATSVGDSDGVWRTINGRRVFIKNGQSVGEAMKQSLGQKKDSPKSFKSYPRRMPINSALRTISQDIRSDIEKLGAQNGFTTTGLGGPTMPGTLGHTYSNGMEWGDSTEVTHGYKTGFYVKVGRGSPDLEAKVSDIFAKHSGRLSNPKGKVEGLVFDRKGTNYSTWYVHPGFTTNPFMMPVLVDVHD